FLITAAATSPATPAASPATSGSNRGRRLSKVHRATEWLKPSFARSSATMSASVRDQMPKPSCVSCQLGSPITTRFTRTRLSDIVHPVSSSQLTQDPDRVRSFGGYNIRLLQFQSTASFGQFLPPAADELLIGPLPVSAPHNSPLVEQLLCPIPTPFQKTPQISPIFKAEERC